VIPLVGDPPPGGVLAPILRVTRGITHSMMLPTTTERRRSMAEQELLGNPDGDERTGR
jgi:hypothetical protein